MGWHGVFSLILPSKKEIILVNTNKNVIISGRPGTGKTYIALKWIEETLIKDGMFSLPGRKELLKSDAEYEVILVDATETPVERPQKNKENTIQERKKDIP